MCLVPAFLLSCVLSYFCLVLSQILTQSDKEQQELVRGVWIYEIGLVGEVLLAGRDDDRGAFHRALDALQREDVVELAPRIPHPADPCDQGEARPWRGSAAYPPRPGNR